MHRTNPSVFIIGQTSINEEGLANYLESIGAQDWATDAPSEVEQIVEVMSRSCYKSFGTQLNPNITKVREGNDSHLRNIIESGHGSVLEHGWISFMFTDVSRVFTHELVRHRVGVAISQESLRFVLANDLGLWVPLAFEDDYLAIDVMEGHWRDSERAYHTLLERGLALAPLSKRSGSVGEKYPNWDNLPFETKKYYTSAARRVLPIGMSTNIGWSCNIRTLRHVISERTAPKAEEEIRLVFSQVAGLMQGIYPNLFGDFKEEEGTFNTPNWKV